MIKKDKYGDVLRRSSMVEGEGVGDDLGLFPTDNIDAKVVQGIWYL